MGRKVGDIETITYQWRWQECQVCGIPAAFRLTYLAHNARNNPASLAYQHDDCSWCNDAEAFACKKHQEEVRRDCPPSMSWCASFPLKNFKHMGFYKIKVEKERQNGTAKC